MSTLRESINELRRLAGYRQSSPLQEAKMPALPKGVARDPKVRSKAEAIWKKSIKAILAVMKKIEPDTDDDNVKYYADEALDLVSALQDDLEKIGATPPSKDALQELFVDLAEVAKVDDFLEWDWYFEQWYRQEDY